MFNVCPGCGEYNNAKAVIASPERAVCPECKHEHTFFSLPLFVVTGASGTGKTTAALELLNTTQDVVILDQDILWSDAFNTPEDDFRNFRNTWLRLVKNIHQAGKSVVLFGSAIPEQFETCSERRYLSDIHYLALVCEESELKKRLTDRPHWRKSGSQENLERMINLNLWLGENAAQTKPPITLLDTTRVPVSQTVKSIRDWLYEKVKPV